MFTDKEQLLYDSISEIAEYIGHSIKTPISPSLLFLDLGLSFEDKGKIIIAFGQIVRSTDFDDLNLHIFRERLVSIIPVAIDYNDIVISGLIKSLAKTSIPELYPYSTVVDLEIYEVK